MNETVQNQISEFLKGLNVENLYIMNYVDVESIDVENAFDSIFEQIDENRGFDVEIIYYSNAIAYLKKNDPSLNESLEIAIEYGFELKNLNSEVLASLLASQNVRNEFYELQDEINEFFEILEIDKNDDDE